jgi:hypothetical protein
MEPPPPKKKILEFPWIRIVLHPQQTFFIFLRGEIYSNASKSKKKFLDMIIVDVLANNSDQLHCIYYTPRNEVVWV